MVAMAGGPDIRCAPYHTFGSEELSAAAVEALKDRAACLLANHGVIALGRNLEGALSLAGEVEDLAAKYCTALALGEIRILGDAEMERVIDKFRTYGKQEAVDPGLEFGGRVAPGTQVPEG
jgi:L-fuculose-phosphate aldolase